MKKQLIHSEASCTEDQIRNQDQQPFLVQISSKKTKRQHQRRKDNQILETANHPITKVRSESDLRRRTQGQIFTRKLNNLRQRMLATHELKNQRMSFIQRVDETQSPLIGLGPSRPTKANKMIADDRTQIVDGSMKKAATQANLVFQPRQYPQKAIDDKVKRQVYNLFNREIECSICFSQFIKPVTLGCGHSFCQLCLFKYILAYPKKCALCRQPIKSCYSELQVNVILDSISRKFNPTNYSKLRALNDREIKTSKIYQKLSLKFLDAENYRPSLKERIRLFLHHLKQVYSKVRVMVTIIAPLIILIWYFKYRNTIDSSHYWEEMRKHKAIFFSVPYDLTQETIVVRFAQLLSILVGF